MALFRQAGNWIVQHPFESAAVVIALILLAVATVAVLVLATIVLAAIVFAAPITIPAASVVLGLAGFTGVGVAGITASSAATIFLAGVGHVFARIIFTVLESAGARGAIVVVNAVARGIAAVITTTGAAISSHVQIKYDCECKGQDGVEYKDQEDKQCETSDEGRHQGKNDIQEKEGNKKEQAKL